MMSFLSLQKPVYRKLPPSARVSSQWFPISQLAPSAFACLFMEPGEPKHILVHGEIRSTMIRTPENNSDHDISPGLDLFGQRSAVIGFGYEHTQGTSSF